MYSSARPGAQSREVGRQSPLLPILLPACGRRGPRGGGLVKGYGARKGSRWYAVIYEGIDSLHRSKLLPTVSRAAGPTWSPRQQPS